ncbi:MAG: DNA replication/repair protein RecF [Fibrobacterota bacterium]|nr:DNA replication/repair protein RecF [Fibrobacterota bacterium]
MHLDRASLTHFRNYGSQEVAFCPGLNLLSGPNGHGKTNLLEAIHYACLAHSQRTRKDKELIEWGHSSFVLRLVGRIGGQEQIQSVEYGETGSKRVKVNGRESKRLSDLIGHFSVVSFSPEDLDLIRSGPQLRRRFLDILLCQFSLDYLDTLRHYNQALKQRNSLLKQMGSGSRKAVESYAALAGSDGLVEEGGSRRFGADVLAAYDAPLAETGARITVMRRRALADLAPLASECYRSISDGGEALGLSLVGSVSEAEDEAALREDFLRKLAAMRVPERETGLTLSGPHREDLSILLSGRAVRDFGSQGQKRSVALSLKLASARLLEEKNQRPPILLLDDVFAELDEARRRRIGDLIRGKGQVFIANPRAADLPFEAEKVITLQYGHVI